MNEKQKLIRAGLLALPPKVKADFGAEINFLELCVGNLKPLVETCTSEILSTYLAELIEDINGKVLKFRAAVFLEEVEREAKIRKLEKKVAELKGVAHD